MASRIRGFIASVLIACFECDVEMTIEIESPDDADSGEMTCPRCGTENRVDVRVDLD